MQVINISAFTPLEEYQAGRAGVPGRDQGDATRSWLHRGAGPRRLRAPVARSAPRERHRGARRGFRLSRGVGGQARRSYRGGRRRARRRGAIWRRWRQDVMLQHQHTVPLSDDRADRQRAARVEPSGKPKARRLIVRNPIGLVKTQTLTLQQRAEVEQLAAVCRQCEGLDFACIPEPVRALPDQQTNHLLYFHAGAIVGSMSGSMPAGPEVELCGIVHPDHRRKGIGRALLAAAVEEYRQRVFRSILLVSESTSHSGRAFAEAVGARYRFSEHRMELVPPPSASTRTRAPCSSSPPTTGMPKKTDPPHGGFIRRSRRRGPAADPPVAARTGPAILHRQNIKKSRSEASGSS